LSPDAGPFLVASRDLEHEAALKRLNGRCRSCGCHAAFAPIVTTPFPFACRFASLILDWYNACNEIKAWILRNLFPSNASPSSGIICPDGAGLPLLPPICAKPWRRNVPRLVVLLFRSTIGRAGMPILPGCVSKLGKLTRRAIAA